MALPDHEDDAVEGIRCNMTKIGLKSDLDAAPTLAAYVRLLERWNRTYNLTGDKDPAQIRALHLADCLAVVPTIRRTFASTSPNRVLDVGSGAGLPGVVLAILHPRWQVDCVDAVGKKAAFIRQTAGQLNLSNLGSIHSRVESIESSSAKAYDLVISRAFSSLPDLVELTRALLKSDGVWVAMKGKVPNEELAALPDGVVIRGIQKIEPPGIVADRCLILLSNNNTNTESVRQQSSH